MFSLCLYKPYSKTILLLFKRCSSSVLQSHSAIILISSRVNSFKFFANFSIFIYKSFLSWIIRVVVGVTSHSTLRAGFALLTRRPTENPLFYVQIISSTISLVISVKLFSFATISIWFISCTICLKRLYFLCIYSIESSVNLISAN